MSRSNRCDVCRQRKIKCGEQRPSCQQCVRSGWTCPGYIRRWKFIDENPDLTQHYAKRKYIRDDVSEPDSLRGRRSKEAKLADQRLDKMLVIWRARPSPSASRPQHWTATIPRALSAQSQGPELMYWLGRTIHGKPNPLRYLGTFFEHIPARLGRNSALDAAVGCICAINRTETPRPYQHHRLVYQSYCIALSALSNYLTDERQRLEPETLCASILLQMCEIAVNFQKKEWSTLVQGTASLIHARGVHRYGTAFEHAMLESQVSQIFAQSMRCREMTFLQSPAWKSVFKQKPSSSPSTSSQQQQSVPRSVALRSDLLALILDLPDLFTQCRSLAEQGDVIAPSNHGLQSRYASLKFRISSIKSALQGFIAGNSNILSPATSGDSVSYLDILAATLDCVAHSALFATHRLLLLLLANQRTNTDMRKAGLVIEDNAAIEIEHWRLRAQSAYAFVKSESEVAAKPLEFGLQQFQGLLMGSGFT